MALPSGPAAGRARLREHHVAARPADAAGRMTMRTSPLRRCHAAGSPARLTHVVPCHHDLPMHAAHRLEERHRQGGVQIRSGFRTSAVARADRVQDLGEELGERRRLRAVRSDREIEPGELERRSRRTVHRHLSPGVVLLPPRRVRECLVRFRDAVKQGFSRTVSRVDPGMVPPREAAVRPLDLGDRRAGSEPEEGVEVHRLVFALRQV